MALLLFALVVCLLAGCQAGDPPEPPVVPPPEDLSTWGSPALMQLPPARKPLPQLLPDKPGKAETVQAFQPGTIYTIAVAVGTPLDIVLEQGEKVRDIMAGDRTPQPEGHPAPWDVKEGKDGEGEAARSHIFVTVSEAGLHQGVTITTTRRIYYLALASVKQASTRVLRWTYLPVPEHERPAEDKPRLLPHPDEHRQYHVGYTLAAKGAMPAWQPRHVVDDGTKMYLVYPEVTLFSTVPMVRMIGPNGPQLVNSRQFLNVVIIDQLAPRLELRAGIGDTAEVVTITRGQLRTIACPGDMDCPQWPAAAQQLAGR
jgi:type IV secretion system protein VirB9